MVNFNDLKKLDVRKIDINKIDVTKIDVAKMSSALMANKDMLGQAVAIGISLFILFGQVGGYFAATAENNGKLQKLKANEGAISEYTRLQGQVKRFRKSLGKALGPDEFASAVADLAASQGVQILQFSPENRVDSNQLSTAVGARLSVRAKKYADFLRFLNAVEHAPFAVRVDTCTIVKGNESVSGNAAADRDSFVADLTLLSVDIRK